MQTEKIHVEINIKAPIQKVFDFVTNPHKIPLALPGLIENTNVPELPVKAGDTFNFKYKMVGIVLEGVTTVEEITSPTTYNFSTTVGAISHWKEQLSDDNGSTNFSLDIEYEVPQTWTEAIKISLIQKTNQKSAEKFLENVKSAVELGS